VFYPAALSKLLFDRKENPMLFQIKVKVNLSKMVEFGQKLKNGALDRSCIRGETYCLKNDPAVGFSIWEAASKAEFEATFAAWSSYYEEIEIAEVITPQEAMGLLFNQIKRP
jgi:hypothetical protein